MKKLVLLCTLALSASLLTAQVTFFDDFESYNVGDFIAQSSPNWTTWTNSPGSAEDAPVTDEQAFSGTKSLKLYSPTSSGGPDDVILPFGAKYTTGVFEMEMYMYVVTGTGAYFNYQAETTPGQTWAVEVYFTEAGQVSFAGKALEFPHDEWFKLNVHVNLDLNYWRISVNDAVQSAFINGVNALASMDLFPVNPDGPSQFYIDDIGFTHDPYVAPAVDALMANISIKASTVSGSELAIQGTVRNAGSDPITSMDIIWSDGVNEYTDNLPGLNIPYGGTYDFNHSTLYSAIAGQNVVSVRVENPNGTGDDADLSNNRSDQFVTGYLPAANKRVVIEEGTGTWCQWCPRGAVFMDSMYALYPDYFIPIAVHNGDPMTNPDYDGPIPFTGYPQMYIMRENVFGFGTMADVETRFFSKVIEPAPATLHSSLTYDPATGNLLVGSEADFTVDVSGNYRLAVVLTEDGVTGTTSGYAQVNAYAGGGNGPMGGYENLPSPVPASMMVYDHVGRILVGGFAGASGSIPASVSAGEKVTWYFETVNIPAEYNTDNMHVVTMLLGPNGQIVNANTQTFNEALNVVLANKEVYRNDYVEIFPNPFSGSASLRLQLEQPSQVTLRVFDAMGAQVAFRNYGQLDGDLVFPLEASNLPAGIYQVHIQLDDQLMTKKVVIQR